MADPLAFLQGALVLDPLRGRGDRIPARDERAHGHARGCAGALPATRPSPAPLGRRGPRRAVDRAGMPRGLRSGAVRQRRRGRSRPELGGSQRPLGAGRHRCVHVRVVAQMGGATRRRRLPHRLAGARSRLRGASARARRQGRRGGHALARRLRRLGQPRAPCAPRRGRRDRREPRAPRRCPTALHAVRGPAHGEGRKRRAVPGDRARPERQRDRTRPRHPWTLHGQPVPLSH